MERHPEILLKSLNHQEPSDEDEVKQLQHDQTVRILDPSLRDFLVQSTSEFHVNEPKKHGNIAQYCLDNMRCHLRRNICDLVSPGTCRADIDPDNLRLYLPPELQYSCRYWVHHLNRSHGVTLATDDILLFLKKHFLHWVEAMSLLGFISEVVEILGVLSTIIPNDNDLLSILIRDAKRFTQKNLQIADQAPLQIYWAGLLFAPRTSVIRTEFQSELPGSICQSPQVPETWGADLQILEGHSDWISSVSFSPDGQLVASGSDDRRIRLWETATGALRKTLEGPSSCVTSLSFSPDSQLLASGQLLSKNGLDSLLIWDIASGSIRHSLQGHGGSVESVCFSPDGRVLVSGSSDETVRLWNTSTGDLQQTLEDHCDKVFCVAASPDGQFFASGSKDRQVHVWELETGDLVALYTTSAVASSLAFSPDSQFLACGGNSKDVTIWDLTTDDTKTVQGHSSWIRSVAFSPDGRLLAGASQDKTIYLWDIETGGVQETLEGHFNYVTSVAFSPDGRLLASGSNDQTLRVWEIAMDPQQKLERNSDSGSSVVFSSRNRLDVNRVNSMTFSPDGRLLASSSNDNIVRLWDTATGHLVHTLNDHSDWVLSVGFSPDGSQLASGSMDRTIKLWNVTTGVLQQSLEGHSETVRSVVFSPDGQLLVSGSNDKTACVWDLMTGSLQQTLKVEGTTEDLSSAIHNLANFDDEDQRERPSSASSDDVLTLSIDQGQWISVNGQNVLWLPPDFRPCFFAAYKSRIALGHISGRVCFFQFSS